MKHCVECAEQLKANAKFCFKCGARQSDAACNTKLEPDWVLCPHCGKKIERVVSQTEPLIAAPGVNHNKATLALNQEELTLSEKQSREAMTIHKMLPQYNCGKCGYKNCWAFAITVASSDSVPISNCHNFEINFFF